jgi:hypothetical protein
MANYRVISSDNHVFEPPDLWRRLRRAVQKYRIESSIRRSCGGWWTPMILRSRWSSIPMTSAGSIAKRTVASESSAAASRRGRGGVGRCALCRKAF